MDHDRMADLNLTEILKTALDTAIGLLVGTLLTLLTRVSKKQYDELVRKVDDHHSHVSGRLNEIERENRNAATEGDLHALRAELRSDLDKAVSSLKQDFASQIRDLREDLRLSRNH